MFWDQPDGHRPSPVEQDLRARWQVTGPTRRIAEAMMAAARTELSVAADRDLAVYVGLALPGKTYGIWTLGQPVEEAPGYFLATDTASARRARDLADDAAGAHLAGRAGTSSWARLSPGEFCAVFEGYHTGGETAAPEVSPAERAEITDRLEYLRGEIKAEQISQGELAELQGLAAYIEPGDVELLEWAGVPEHPNSRVRVVLNADLAEALTSWWRQLTPEERQLTGVEYDADGEV